MSAELPAAQSDDFQKLVSSLSAKILLMFGGQSPRVSGVDDCQLKDGSLEGA